MKIYEKDEENEISTTGGDGEIWRLKGEKGLCAKILTNPELSIENLKNEFSIGRFLKNNNINVPKYIGIFVVEGKSKNEEKSKSYLGLVMEIIPNCLEFRQISDYDPRRVNANTLMKIELEKIKKININNKYFTPIDLNIRNILYDAKKDVVYLIDFTRWIITEKFRKEKINKDIF